MVQSTLFYRRIERTEASSLGCWRAAVTPQAVLSQLKMPCCSCLLHSRRGLPLQSRMRRRQPRPPQWPRHRQLPELWQRRWRRKTGVSEGLKRGMLGVERHVS